MTHAVKFTENGAEDFDHWQQTDPRIFERIKTLLRDAREHPFTGIGKPEPLKHDLSGYWSRRITREHRLVVSQVELHGCATSPFEKGGLRGISAVVDISDAAEIPPAPLLQRGVILLIQHD